MFEGMTEYGYTLRTRAKSKSLLWILNLTLMFLLIPGLFIADTRKAKVQWLLTSALIAVAGQLAQSQSQDSRILSNDYESSARQARRQNLYSAYTAKPVINENPHNAYLLSAGAKTSNGLAATMSINGLPKPEDMYFDVEEMFTRAEFPHIMLVAPSGSGKTTTLNWLAKVAASKGHNVTVLTPHLMSSNEFADYHRITNDLEIYRFIDQLATEMKKRYTLQPWEDYADQFSKETVIIDEAVTLFESFKEFDKDYELDVRKSWVKLLVEARKVGIKIILATQSNRVGAIGLKGRGDIADCLVKMLIGRSAKKRVTTLVKKKEWTEDQAFEARSYPYFAVIDDDTTNRLLIIPEQTG